MTEAAVGTNDALGKPRPPEGSSRSKNMSYSIRIGAHKIKTSQKQEKKNEHTSITKEVGGLICANYRMGVHIKITIENMASMKLSKP